MIFEGPEIVPVGMEVGAAVPLTADGAAAAADDCPDLLARTQHTSGGWRLLRDTDFTWRLQVSSCACFGTSLFLYVQWS